MSDMSVQVDSSKIADIMFKGCGLAVCFSKASGGLRDTKKYYPQYLINVMAVNST